MFTAKGALQLGSPGSHGRQPRECVDLVVGGRRGGGFAQNFAGDTLRHLGDHAAVLPEKGIPRVTLNIDESRRYHAAQGVDPFAGRGVLEPPGGSDGDNAVPANR